MSSPAQSSGSENPEPASKRLRISNCLYGDEYFMAFAFLAAEGSEDPATKVGACIVDKDERVVGLGYNRMPLGCDQLPWAKKDRDGNKESLDTKHKYVCHAEINAILNKNATDLKDCTMYVALFPCNECAKMIIQSGITEVVYKSDKHAHKTTTMASKRLLDTAGVKHRQYKPKSGKIVIDFSKIEWNNKHE